MNTEYEIITVDQQAKRAVYENKIGQKTITFPHVAVYLRSAKQVRQFVEYLNLYNYSHSIRGLVFPIDRADLQAEFDDDYKKTTLVMLDPLTEIFYYGTHKEEIYRQYRKIEGLPKEVVDLLDFPNKTQNWAKKDNEYKEDLNLILNDAGIRTKLIEAVANHNLKNDVDIMVPFSPLIKDMSSFFVCKSIYDQTQRMFLGGLTNIEESLGKRIALYLNVHASALSNTKLINEIVGYVKKDEHQAIVLKILTTGSKTIKDLSYFEAKNLVDLMKAIGLSSKAHRIPAHLLCSNSLGLMAVSHGFDSFSQPLNRHEREVEMAFSKEMQEKMKAQDPNYEWGQIYMHEIKDYVKFSNYRDIIEGNGFQLPSPAREYSGTLNPRHVTRMTKHEFYEHCRMTLLETRNYEMDEILTAINKREIRGYKSRFKNFFNNMLLPQ